MKFRKEMTVLAVLIMVLSFAAAVAGIYSSGGPGRHEFTSVRGETVEIYGEGLYRNDSVSMASQAIAQDVVTVLLGIPLLVVSLALARKGRLKGKILLAGTLAYFLYTYASYSFTSMFNDLFLVDVSLMSLSFFAFLLAMMSLDLSALRQSFSPKLPVRTIAGFLIFISAVIGLMWVGRIAPSLSGGAAPIGLEHYTTLVVQALDLGFVVPAAMLSGLLLLQRKPFGLLLSSILCVKAVTMLTALTAMIIGQLAAGVHMAAVEIILFPAFNLAGIAIAILLFKHIKEPETTP
ncbi:hypothetical protein [Paenibacillus macerans]|uniref:hypothetical protein n=1 Tax=Paenibacillus macerans TaxID=44252 RepID=UPI003D320846